MVKQMLLVCDRCGSKKNVLSGEGNREDRLNMSVDLCESCWAKLIKEYNISTRVTKPRRTFNVISEKEIPTED